MRSKKILNILPFDVLGSIQRRSLLVATHVRNVGINTVFIVPDGNNEFSKMALKTGFTVYKTSYSRPPLIRTTSDLIRFIKWAVKLPGAVLQALTILQKEMPDIVQINGFVCLQEAIASALYRARTSIWNLIGTVYPRFLLLLLSPLIRLQGTRVYIAQNLIRYYFGKQNDRIIREPVDTEQFHPSIQRNKIESVVGGNIKKHQFVLGFVGSISPVKGLEYLIESMAMIKKRLPGIILLIVGGKLTSQEHYYSEIHQLVKRLNIEDDVIFTGHISHDKLPEVFRLFDTLVLPSVNEGTPVCILEAMSSQVPVIATRVGGISEQVINKRTGILVPPKDPHALTNAIISLVLDSDKRLQMAQNGRKRAIEMFSVEKCKSEYTRLYLRVLEESQSGMELVE